MTTKRELERKAQHVLGPSAVVIITKTLEGHINVNAYGHDDSVVVTRKTRSEACEALDNRLAALDAGGCSWKGDE